MIGFKPTESMIKTNEHNITSLIQNWYSIHWFRIFVSEIKKWIEKEIERYAKTFKKLHVN